MANRDAVSEAAAQNNSAFKQAVTTVAKPLRAALGMAANHKAQQAMLGSFVSHQDLAPPTLANNLVMNDHGQPLRDANNKFVKNETQMALDKMQFKPPGGPAQTVEGWVLPPQNGQPTVVFFGGSNFDRAEYRINLEMMATDAKDKGMGFAVFDYPEGVNEEMAHQFVDQLQNHLHQDLGITLDNQAYAGYSQGSHLATFAAANNPDTAGLHITSGFSSARMAQKNEMDKAMGPLASLVEKRQLTEVWDNIPLADDIATRRAQQPDGVKMPVSAVYDTQEDFGNANNRHMTPLIDTLQRQGDTVAVQTSAGTDHLDMLTSGAHSDGLKQFMDSTQNYVQNANRQFVGTGTALAAGAQVAAVGPEADAPGKMSVRDALRSAGRGISTTASSIKNSLADRVDAVRTSRLDSQIERRQEHGNRLEERQLLLDQIKQASPQERQAMVSALSQELGKQSADSIVSGSNANAYMDMKDKLDLWSLDDSGLDRAITKNEQRVDRNTQKLDSLSQDKQKIQEKVERRHAQPSSSSISV